MRDLSKHEADHGFTFFPAQRSVLEQASVMGSGIVEAETGCGKTLIGLYLPVAVGAKRALYIVPAGVSGQWGDEYQKFAGRLGIQVQFWTYEEAANAPMEMARFNPDIVVLDEAHRCKNFQSQRGKMLTFLTDVTYRWVLTATPVFDNPLDLLTLRCLIYKTKPDKMKIKDWQEAIEKKLVPELMKPITIKLSLKECNPKIPNMNLTVTRLPMEAAARKAYDTLLSFYDTDEGLDEFNRSSNLGRTLAALEELKMRYIKDKIDSRPEQCVVIGSRVCASDKLQSILGNVSRVDSTTTGKHHQHSRNFKAGVTKAMLMGIKCAEGHSYSQCPRAIIHSVEWSPGFLKQAIGRVYRVNSQLPVDIEIVVYKDTIEEQMLDVSLEKMNNL